MFSALFRFFKSSRQTKKDSIKQILKSVEDFKDRPIYKELTVAIIDTTPDDKLLQTIFDNLSEKIDWDNGKEYETLLSLSKARQAIFVIWCLEGEINNGGFNQYYFNSSEQFANLTPDALQLIGASKFADLVARANKAYEDENEKITKHQDGTLEGFSKSYDDNPLNKFDQEFYNLYEVENLQQLQIDLIRNYKMDFVDK